MKKNKILKECSPINENEHIYRRLSDIVNILQKLIRILVDEESISDCNEKRLEDLGKEVY